MEYEMDFPPEERSCSTDDCEHSGMISDPYLIKVVFEVLLADQIADKAVFERIDKMDENVIISEVHECKHVKDSIFNDEVELVKTEEI